MRSEIIHSPALYLGKVEVSEDGGSHGHWFSGTRLKGWLYPAFHWGLMNLPRFCVTVPLRALFLVGRVSYVWRRNPLRQSCEYVAEVAAEHGQHHQPREIYREYLKRLEAVIVNLCDLYRDGLDAVVDRVQFADEDVARVKALLAEHGGVVLAMPHNISSAFSGGQVTRTFPTLSIARNSTTIARTKVALTFFERMQLSMLMVRDGNPFELSRTMFSVLREGKTVLATLDNVYKEDNGVEVTVFGERVGLNPWAAKIAARMGVPVVPLYFRSRGGQVQAMVGESLITDDVEQAIEHYMRFIEQNIIEDPASWAYLGDKRWRRVLRQACRRKRSGGEVEAARPSPSA